MLLQHGTSALNLKSILANGIEPRGKAVSNWEQESHKDRVYLTSAYAFYFAQMAAKDENDLLILEVDVHKESLNPDEDFLEQTTRGIDGIYLSIEERTTHYKVIQDNMTRKNLSILATKSLSQLGTCCHNGKIIPASITRYAIIPHKDITSIIVNGFDPFITIQNFRFCGLSYINQSKQLIDKYEIKHRT